MPSTVTVTCEQAVYGSFPFRDQGYDILTASAGCRPEWLAAFARYCRDLGQPPSEAMPLVDHLLFARKIPAGPWVVALGSAQGCDDRGRPGAWGFHGLFLSNRDYRALGATPFPLRTHLIDRFSAGMSLSGGPLLVNLTHEPPDPETDPAKIRWIAKGRKLRCVGSHNTFRTTERFWRSLGSRTKSRRSLTTWAFRSDTPFQWSCVPDQRIADEPDATDRNILRFPPEELELRFSQHRSASLGLKLRILAGLVATLLAILILRSILRHSASQPVPGSEHAGPLPAEAAPSIASFGPSEMPVDVQEYLAERLNDWAEKLGAQPDHAGHDPAAEAARIARAIRYDGPLMPDNLPNDDPDNRSNSIANAYDEAIRRQSAYRPWPDEAERANSASPAYALATLAWCVRSDVLATDARRIRTISDARRWFERFADHVLPASIPADLPSTGLEARYPELIEYRLHLSRIVRIE